MRLFLWPTRVLYLGPSPALDEHLYGTVALHVGVDRPFRIRVEGSAPALCRVAVVPANTRHELDFDGGIHAKLFVERDSDDYLYLRRRFPHREGAASIGEDTDAVECFGGIYEEDPTKEVIEARLDRLFVCDGSLRLALDPRVRVTIERILDEPDRNLPQERLAAAVDLSPSRWLHLFRDEVGVSYRRFRRWKRLVAALERFHDVDNMTRVALDSGFADATHFSHSFRETFGVNPAFVFRGIRRFEVGRSASSAGDGSPR